MFGKAPPPPPQQQPQPKAPKQRHHSRLRRIGDRFGRAVVFGAGTTLGSNLMRGVIGEFKKKD